MKETAIQLRMTHARKAEWRRHANRAGLTLTEFVERCVQEAVDLANALELQTQDELRRRRAREKIVEAEYREAMRR